MAVLKYTTKDRN